MAAGLLQGEQHASNGRPKCCLHWVSRFNFHADCQRQPVSSLLPMLGMGRSGEDGQMSGAELECSGRPKWTVSPTGR